MNKMFNQKTLARDNTKGVTQADFDIIWGNRTTAGFVEVRLEESSVKLESKPKPTTLEAKAVRDDRDKSFNLDFSAYKDV